MVLSTSVMVARAQQAQDCSSAGALFDPGSSCCSPDEAREVWRNSSNLDALESCCPDFRSTTAREAELFVSFMSSTQDESLNGLAISLDGAVCQEDGVTFSGDMDHVTIAAADPKTGFTYGHDASFTITCKFAHQSC
jgi:hypothetical protein